jgi:hypothetical protein
VSATTRSGSSATPGTVARVRNVRVRFAIPRRYESPRSGRIRPHPDPG